MKKQKKQYNVLLDKWSGYKTHNKRISLELLGKADIIFCEWSLGNIVFYSKYKKPHQKLYVRIHRFESSENYWNNQIYII